MIITSRKLAPPFNKELYKLWKGEFDVEKTCIELTGIWPQELALGWSQIEKLRGKEGTY
jgi:hypothetical protein